MGQWVLIVFLMTPGGDFAGKYNYIFHSRQECEVAKKNLQNYVDPLHMRREGLCVTWEHWTGKKYMPGVPLD